MAEKIGAGQVAPVMYDYGQDKFFLQDNDDLVNPIVTATTDPVTGVVELFGSNGEKIQPANYRAAEYVFYLPCRQQVGVPVDYSGNGRSITRKSGLTEAESWAAPGYLTTQAESDSYVGYTTGTDADYNKVTIFSCRLKMAAPVANVPILGNGVVGAQGWYYSARTTGKILLAIQHLGGQYSTGEVPGVVLDSTEHTFGFIFDGPSKNLYCYVDGGLAFQATNIAVTGNHADARQFAIGAACYFTTAQTGAASVTRDHHYLEFDAMPVNADQLMLKLATSSCPLLDSDIVRA